MPSTRDDEKVTFEKNFSTLYTASYSRITQSIERAPNNRLLLDNISTWYIFEDEVRMGFSVLRKYENVIRANAVSIDFQDSWKYKPEYCSFDVYGTTDLWYLIMFLNNIDTVKKFDFKGKTILVPSDEFLDGFAQVIEKENRMLNSLNIPIRIYKHYLKRLDEPSKQVLPSDFDEEMDGLTSLKEYKDITETYLTESNYQHYTDGIVKGLLKSEFFEIYNRQYIKYKPDLYATPDFNLSDDYYDPFFNSKLQKIQNDEDDVVVEKTGFLRPFKSGNYKFRVNSSSDYQLYLDDKNILSYQIDKHSTIPDMSYVKNFLEENWMNSDFKRRSLCGYDETVFKEIHDRDGYFVNLLYNDTLNQTVLNYNLTSTYLNNLRKSDGELHLLSTIAIFDKNIITDGNNTYNRFLNDEYINKEAEVEFEGDLYFRIDYYLPTGTLKGKLLLEYEIEYNDGTKKKYDKESSAYNIQRKPTQLNSEILSVSKDEVFIEGKTIKTVKCDVYLILSDYSANTFGEQFYISHVYLYTLENSYYEMEDSIFLDKDHTYKFKSSSQQPYLNSFNFFKLQYKYENEEYKDIPIGWFNILAETFNGYNDFNSKVFSELKEFYGYDLLELGKSKKAYDEAEDKIQYLFANKNDVNKLLDYYTITSDPYVYSYLMHRKARVIRMDLINNDTNEIIEEYFLSRILNDIDIFNHFGLTSGNQEKYRMSYRIPINLEFKDNKVYINSFGRVDTFINLITLHGNTKQRLNIYLGSSKSYDGNDEYSSKVKAINTKTFSNEMTHTEKLVLLGTCNFIDSYSNIIINNATIVNQIKALIEDDGYNINTMVIDVITDGIVYTLGFNIDEYSSISIESANNLPATGIYTLYESRVTIADRFVNGESINKIFDFSENVNKFMVSLAWYNTTYELQTNKNRLNYLTTEFMALGLNNEYKSVEELILVLNEKFMNEDIINTITLQDFINIEEFKSIFYSKFGNSIGMKTDAYSSSMMWHPFYPESGCNQKLLTTNEGYMINNVIYDNSDYIKEIVTDDEYNTYLNKDGALGFNNGHLRLFLHTPLKNTLYKMLPNTDLVEDFILYCRFKHVGYTHYENGQNIFSTKQGIFGFIFDYGYNNDNKNSYMLLFNMYKNPKYLSSGVYKFNKSFAERFYNGDGYTLLIDSMFKDNFKDIYKITEVDLDFDLAHSDKEIMFMNKQGWIFIREVKDVNDNKTFPIKIDDNDIEPKDNAYYGGKLGFFMLNVDGLDMQMTLYN